MKTIPTIAMSPNRLRPESRPRRSFPMQLVLMMLVVALFAFTAWIVKQLITPAPTPWRLTHRVTRGDLLVTVTEQGILESAENTEIKCKVRGRNAVLWVIDSGSMVQPGDELLRIDSSFIEEQIDERTKYAHWSRSSAERSAANVKRAGTGRLRI